MYVNSKIKFKKIHSGKILLEDVLLIKIESNQAKSIAHKSLIS
jgi:hypothetical protein